MALRQRNGCVFRLVADQGPSTLIVVGVATLSTLTASRVPTIDARACWIVRVVSKPSTSGTCAINVCATASHEHHHILQPSAMLAVSLRLWSYTSTSTGTSAPALRAGRLSFRPDCGRLPTGSDPSQSPSGRAIAGWTDPATARLCNRMPLGWAA